jgi:prephenate dehydrogenase
VCTPVGRIVEDVRNAAKHCPENTLITDVGSTKQAIVAALEDTLPRGCRFLGSHPLAGSEQTGPAHASADLFEGRVALITPTKSTRAEDFDFLESFWEALGCVVIRLSPEEHDYALAITSHLPHAVAMVLAACMPEKYFRLSGGGLLDTTRIASSDPELWGQIFLQNRDNLLAALEQFGSRLGALCAAVRGGNTSEILQLLSLAKKNRDALGS